MVTILDKQLKRQITVEGADYTVALDSEGMRLTGKGKRRPEVELRWNDLLSGEAALAVALRASLAPKARARAGPGEASAAVYAGEPATRTEPVAREPEGAQAGATPVARKRVARKKAAGKRAQ